MAKVRSVALWFLLSLFAWMLFIVPQIAMMDTSNQTISDEQVLIGEASGHNGNISVEVYVEHEKIVSVTIKEHNETIGIADEALIQIPKEIVAANSIDIDTVSGATVTSKGIIQAVSSALSKAGIKHAEAEKEPPIVASEPYPGYSAIAASFEREAKRAEKYAPKIVTLKNGVQVQRTPSEFTAGAYHTPGDSISYNTYWLRGDKRGCSACHESLNDLIRDMDYLHVYIDGTFKTEATVLQCLSCHTYSPDYMTTSYNLGDILHAIHYSRETGAFAKTGGNCYSCHNATGNGKGMELWDIVKYDRFHGIVDVPSEKVANMNPAFSFTQDEITATEDIFPFGYLYYATDYMRTAALETGTTEIPEALKEEGWEIEVTGEVNHPVKLKLTDLIAAGVSEKVILKNSCTINPIGGSFIINVEVTGIPLSYLVEKAGGMKGKPVSAYIACYDGFEMAFTYDQLDFGEAYLVYEINGQRLSVSNGYPCTMWVPGASSAVHVKHVSKISLSNDPDPYVYVGWPKENGGWFNKPNIGIRNIAEGQIFQKGEEIVMEGYTDSIDKHVTSVEFSFDRGKTWTKYDLGKTQKSKWIYWTYRFTPNMGPGSYVIQMRATNEAGEVSPEVVTTMINVKDTVSSKGVN